MTTGALEAHLGDVLWFSTSFSPRVYVSSPYALALPYTASICAVRMTNLYA